MAAIVRFADSDKVRAKVNACRNSGIKVVENFITGMTTAEYDSVIVLKCTRQGPNKWMVEYNEEFWEEIDVPDRPETPQTQTLIAPIPRPSPKIT